MRIDELNIKDEISDLDPKQPLPWDMTEDLIIFMKNESGFYRKHLYPMLLNVQETVQNGGEYNKKDFIPIIEKAIISYVKKYDINRKPEEMMSPAQKMECVTKLLTDEVENFHNGEY